VPASLISNPSPSAIAVVPTVAPPSIRFNSVAVVVTATSSFIFGEVNVLFVTVAVETVDIEFRYHHLVV